MQQLRPGPQAKVPLLHGLQVRVQPQAGQRLEALLTVQLQPILLAGQPANQLVTPLLHLGQHLGLLASQQVIVLLLHIQHIIIQAEAHHTLQLQLGQQASQQASQQVDQQLLHIQLRGQPVRVPRTLQRPHIQLVGLLHSQQLHRAQRRQLTQQPGQQVNLQPQHITQQQLGRHRSQQVIQPQQPGQQIDLPAGQQIEQPPPRGQLRGQQAKARRILRQQLIRQAGLPRTQQPRRVQPPLHIQQRGQQVDLQQQHITQPHLGQQAGPQLPRSLPPEVHQERQAIAQRQRGQLRGQQAGTLQLYGQHLGLRPGQQQKISA